MGDIVIKRTPWNKGKKLPYEVHNKGKNYDLAVTESKVQEVVQMVVSGESHKEIASKLGIARNTVRDFKKRHQEAIEKELLRVLDSLPDIVGIDMEEIKAAKILSRMIRSKVPLATKSGKPTKENPTQFTTIDEVMIFLNYVSKKSDGYKKALGLLPSSTPAPVLMFINNDNRKQMMISPVMEKLVEQLTGKLLSSDEAVGEIE